MWGSDQEKAFKQLKDELSKPMVLTLYNCLADVKVSADASFFGLGAVLFQLEEQQWKPVAFASIDPCPKLKGDMPR